MKITILLILGSLFWIVPTFLIMFTVIFCAPLMYKEEAKDGIFSRIFIFFGYSLNILFALALPFYACSASLNLNPIVIWLPFGKSIFVNLPFVDFFLR